MDEDQEEPSKDAILHIVLGAVVFTFASCFVAWPEIQALLA